MKDNSSIGEKMTQVRHMERILSLEGPLLTKEQKEDILRVTIESSITDGFRRIDYWKGINRQGNAT